MDTGQIFYSTGNYWSDTVSYKRSPFVPVPELPSAGTGESFCRSKYYGLPMYSRAPGNQQGCSQTCICQTFLFFSRFLAAHHIL